MLSASPAVSSGHLSPVELQSDSCQRNSDDDATSQCSTISGNHDCEECFSNAGLEVDTLMIFDWDDTLFPTSWMQQHHLFSSGLHLTDEQAAQLQRMADVASRTLQNAIRLGKVVIVTNAEQGWIEMSCTKFMPSLVSLIKSLDIVSAQSTYKRFSEDPCEWKRLSFQHEVELFYGSPDSSQHRNILSVGDSSHELSALMSITKDVANCCGKSIKLLETPSIEQLIEQHDVLSSSLCDVVEHNGCLDIEIGAEHSE